MTRILNGRRNESGGFSLIEMLVASAVFAIAAAVAFILFTAAQKSYKHGENMTDQQQTTRVAFDRLISDLRLAGFNYNPDGDTTRIDEQIEGAWDTAVTIRGDFDFEDPTASVSPESALPGSIYSVVSTGNDEIVTYALAKSGASGPDTLVLRLDTDKPRTRTLRTVTIPNLVTVQNDPPYTLYRITLTDVAGAFPSSPQSASAFIYEPVADNIKEMHFRYYSEGGTLISPDTPADLSDDIGGGDTNVEVRDSIRRITVHLVGMTPDPDPKYTDTTDAVAATQHFRKFELESDVNSENLGKVGIQDLDSNPPPAPTNVVTTPGHCAGILIEWDDPTSSAGISTYSIRQYPSAAPTALSFITAAYPHTEFGVLDYEGHHFVANLATGTNYCFQVQAKDAMGNESAWSPSGTAVCETVVEASTPGTALNFTATGDGTIASLETEILLKWDDVRVNDGTVSGDPDGIGGNTILRDRAGFKLYKDVSSTFTPDDGVNLVVDNTILVSGTTEYGDSDAPTCVDFYYKLVTVDLCNVPSTAAVVMGRSETDVIPDPPSGLSGTRISSQSVEIEWASVAKRIDNSPASIDTYHIYGYLGPSGLSPGSISAAAFTLRGTATVDPKVNNLLYTDSLQSGEVGALNGTESLYYTVTAADNCPNESDMPMPIEIYCDFLGNLVNYPDDGDTLNVGIVPIALDGDDAKGNYVRARVRIADNANPGSFLYDQEVFTYPFIFPAWDASSAPASEYTIYWEIEDNKGCTRAKSTMHNLLGAVACQITPTNPNLSPVTGKPSNLNTSLSWDLVNNSGGRLDLFQIDVAWTATLSATRKLRDLEFPTGLFVTSLGGGEDSPVALDFSFFPLIIPDFADGVCGTASCVVNMQLTWDDPIADEFGSGDLTTIRYHFRDESGGIGMCEFSVFPDLSIVVE